MFKRTVITILSLAGLVLSLSSWGVGPAQTSAQQVPTLTPAVGTCTVNAAGGAAHVTIQAAVNDASCIIIIVNTPESVHYEHDIVVARDVEIAGGGVNNTVLDANSEGRMFDIQNSARVTLRDMTISGGIAQFGGAVQNAGFLTLRNCRIQGSAANFGGGIYNLGVLDIDHCRIDGNSAAFSGGIANENVMTMTRSLVVLNSTGDYGIGIGNRGSSLFISNSTIAENSPRFRDPNPSFQVPMAQIVSFTGVVTIVNSTLVNKRSPDQIAGDTANYAVAGFNEAVVVLRNTLVSKDLQINVPGVVNCTGTIVDGGGNLSTDNSCATTNITNPKINPDGLTDDNGDFALFETIALLPGSPAIDAANVANCPATDQRGVTRPQGAGCDIGAFERTASDPIPPTVTPTAVPSLAPTPTLTPTPVPPRICTVAQTGTPNYTTIGAAVNDATCTTINVAAGTYSEHDITVSRDVEIVGSGRNTTEVNAQRLGRVFDVTAGARVVIRNLTIANALGPGTSVGGGVNNAGILTLSNCIVKDSAIGSSGAGIANTGQLSMDRCIVRDNNGFGIGGIYNNGTMTITSSAIVSNTANFAAGIGAGTDSNPASSLTIINSTIAENYGGNTTTQIATYAGTLIVVNSTLMSRQSTAQLISNSGSSAIILRNSLIAVTQSGNPVCTGAITDDGGNLSSNNSCGIPTVADPKLDPAGLKDNGGDTLTIALQPNSPALDAANAANCPTTDQRGITRPQGAGCDIGAFERAVNDPIPPTATPTPTLVPPTPTYTPIPPTATPASGTLALQIKVYDQTRAPLNNWEVQVFDMADGESVVAQGNTNATGAVTFNIPQGLYKICQTLQGGWQNTYPGGSCYWQTLTNIPSESLSFANRLTGFTSTPTPVVTATPAGVCAPLSRAGWVARSSYAGDVALAIDGSATTFWNNGISYQGQGHWFSVDLGSVRDISQITLNTSADPTNYARKLDVFTSVGGGTFALVGSASPTTPTTIVRFPSRKARYVSVQIAASNFSASWSIGDFDLCNGGAVANLNGVAAEVWKLDTSTRITRVFLPSVIR